MTRFIYATLVGLCGALAVHFITIFSLPSYSQNAPWRTVSANTEIGIPADLTAANSSAGLVAEQFDPFWRSVACRFDLADGVMHVYAPQSPLVWTISVFNPQGLSIFSVNDRIAAGRRIDLVVTGEEQERRVRQEPPAAFEDAIIVPSSEAEGFAMLRLFVPDQTWEPVADRVVDGLRCQTVSLAF